MGAVMMMHGRTDDALTRCDRVIAMADDEPDLFIRVNALSTCCSVFAICGAFDRLDGVYGGLVTLAEQLDNRFTLAATAVTDAIVKMTHGERAVELLRQAYALNDEAGNHSTNATTAMMLAYDELSAGNTVAAAQWAARSLQLALEYGPAFVAQAISATVPIVKRRTPAESAVLLGALRAHRTRKHQTGTQVETDNEIRQEKSLGRALGDQFDALYSTGLGLGENEMITLALAQLGAIAGDSQSAGLD